jgi:hypothetical protein
VASCVWDTETNKGLFGMKELKTEEWEKPKEWDECVMVKQRKGKT